MHSDLPRVSLLQVIAAVLFSFGIVYLNFYVSQSSFISILSCHTVAMVGYGYLVYQIYRGALSVTMGIILGLVLRILLLFAFPQLSDDIYRFLWDGHLLHMGISPLELIPSELISDPSLADPYLASLYDQLNSKSYFTVYPPLSQLVFYCSTLSSEWSPAFSATVMKLFLLGSDGLVLVGLMNLLRRMKKPVFWALIYFLNPLLITETAGQLHFEGMMVMFLALGFWAMMGRRYFIAGCLFAGSVGVKLLPLMFLPLVFKFLWDKGLVRFGLGLGVTLLILFVPFFFSLDLSHFLDSLNLYFQSFEYNASIYFVLRKLGYWIYGYNQIALLGPLLGITTLVYILYLTYRLPGNDANKNFEKLIAGCFHAFACFLFFATTVHPWYLIMLLFLSSILGKRIWVVVWSGVVVLSYSTYVTPDFKQNYSLIALEYLIVSVVIIYSMIQRR